MGNKGASSGKSSGGGASNKTQPKTFSEILREEEDKIRGNNFETALVLDSQGKVIINKIGNGGEVRFTKADVSAMKNNTITHNHPDSGTFTPADVRLLVNSRAKEIRAVSKNGDFSLTRVSNKKSSSFFEDYNKYQQLTSLNLPQGSKAHDKEMRKWLKKNSSKYGYEYKEN